MVFSLQAQRPGSFRPGCGGLERRRLDQIAWSSSSSQVMAWGRDLDDGGASLNVPDPPPLEWARWLVAHEGATVSAGEPDAVAGRIYDKLHVGLGPLVGDAGVDALFARSVMLVQARYAIFGEASILGGAPRLRACLRAQDPAIAAEPAEALFGTFLGLLTTLIGERLTAQALRSTWPTLEHGTSPETKT